MTASELRERLTAIPSQDVAVDLTPQIDATVASLASDAALASLRADVYWPKWHSPWWEMTVLWELGEADRIPKRTARAMVAALNAMPMHTFPLRESDLSPGIDWRRHTQCHCAIGTMAQVLEACGVDVERELPWFTSWFTANQMTDGGYNCDESAYLVDGECPSSMVGTVGIFETLIARGPSETCDRAAHMLLDRELRLGSTTVHNAAERESAKTWGEPCFPRFYFYDVLRGLVAVVRWATQHGRTLPLAQVTPAIEHMLGIAPDGVVRIARVAWADKLSWTPDNEWTERVPARSTTLIDAMGQAGAVAPVLTAHWSRARRDLVALLDAGRIM